MVSSDELKKKAVFFGLEDTLISGKIDSNVNMADVVEILINLKKLEKEKENFHMILISGLGKKFAEEKIKENGLNDFFSMEKIFYMTQETIEAKEEVDKDLYLKKLKANPEYKDEFLKQLIIEEFEKEKGLSKSEMIFIGHDLWFDAFYTMKFSKIDVALLHEAYSFMGQPYTELINGLIYINRKWKDIENLIYGKNPVPDLSALEKFSDQKIRDQLLGGTVLGGLAKISDINKKTQNKNFFI